MRCKKCGITAKHVSRYRHWRESQLCAMCDHRGNRKVKIER